MNTKIWIVVTGLALFLSGCSGEETHKYTEVTAFNFIQGPEKSVVVSFGENPQNHYSFAIRKKDIKKGTKLFSESKNNTNFAVFAELDEQTFIRSSNHATYAQLTVVDIDKKNQIATFKIKAQLMDLDSKALKKIDETIVKITGGKFTVLL
ncbi:MAG: PBP1b-binding outer membrane lipoprotein LpoB [Pseudoalteromonas rhizosphaerae]|jgi:PBP1b-binding outer membrane lipoprotein LpoB|uniref:hypothetical protein n=1 Tax=Pseudoalteromonas rhizosphaerae TaxID=2518973 RepID=UPI0039E2A1E6